MFETFFWIGFFIGMGYAVQQRWPAIKERWFK